MHYCYYMYAYRVYLVCVYIEEKMYVHVNELKYMKAFKARFDAFCTDVKTDVVSVLSVCFITYSMFNSDD